MIKLTRRVKFIIFNLIGLEVTWAACAYGAINDWPLFGVYIGLAYILLHFFLVEHRRRDVAVMLVLGSLGIILDLINTWLNVISFPGNEINFFLIPYWLMVLWLVFSLMLPHSLYWFEKNIYIAAIVGAIGGSFSYLLAHSLGAINFTQEMLVSFSVIFFQWALYFPLSLIIVKYINRSYFKVL